MDANEASDFAIFTGATFRLSSGILPPDTPAPYNDRLLEMRTPYATYRSGGWVEDKTCRMIYVASHLYGGNR